MNNIHSDSDTDIYNSTRCIYSKLVENIKRVVWYCGREIALEFATLRQDQSTSFWIWKASVENVVYEDHWLVLGARSVELWVHLENDVKCVFRNF